MDLNETFERVGYSGSREPTYETLRALHRCHCFSIPFENLDVFARLGPPSLEIDALFEKLIRRRRGGYCFELNGLFSALLRQLGFQVRDLLARVLLGGADPCDRARDHQLMLVTCEGGEWLVDVGFGGGGLTEPLRFAFDEESQQGPSRFRLRPFGPHGTLLQSLESSGWANTYCFTREERYGVDFAVANLWTSTRPESSFLKRRFVSLATERGRVGIEGDEFREQVGAEMRRSLIASDEAYRRLLRERFGIELPAQAKVSER